MKVKAKLEFQLWQHGGDDPGPVAKPGQVMKVVDITKRDVGRKKKLEYLVVEVDGTRYDAWPAHVARIRDD